MNISDSALRLSIYLSCLLVYSFDIPLSYFYCSGKNLGRSVPVPCIDRGPSQGSRVRGAFSSGRSGDQMSHYSEQDRERPIGMYGTTNVPKVAMGIWTPGDKEMMVKALQEEGLDYEALATWIKTKSPDDCVAFSDLVFKSLGHQFAQALLRTTKKRDALGSLSLLFQRVMSTQFEADMIELLELEPDCAFNNIVVKHAGKKTGKKGVTAKQEPHAQPSSSSAVPSKKSHKKKVQPSEQKPSHAQPSSSVPPKSHKKKVPPSVVASPAPRPSKLLTRKTTAATGAQAVVAPPDEQPVSVFEKPATRGSAGITRPRETFSPPGSPARSTTSSRGRGGRGRSSQRGRGGRSGSRSDIKSSDRSTDSVSPRRGRKTVAPPKLKTEEVDQAPQPTKPPTKRPPPTHMEDNAQTRHDEAEPQMPVLQERGQGKRSRSAAEDSDTQAGGPSESPAIPHAARPAPVHERAGRTQPLLVRAGSISPASSRAKQRSHESVEQPVEARPSQTESFLAHLLSQQDMMQDQPQPAPSHAAAPQQQNQQWYQHSGQAQPGQPLEQCKQHQGQQTQFGLTLPPVPPPPTSTPVFPDQYHTKPSPRLEGINPSMLDSEPGPKRQKAEATSSTPGSFARPQNASPAALRGAMPSVGNPPLSTDHDSKPDPSYIGVSYRGGSFYTKIRLDGQSKTFGPYRTDVEAARAYDSLARAHRGSRARCNFNEDGSRNPPPMPSKRNRSRPPQAESQGYSPMETQDSSGSQTADFGGPAYAMPSPAHFPSMSQSGHQAELHQDDDYYEAETQMEWEDDGDDAWVSFS